MRIVAAKKIKKIRESYNERPAGNSKYFIFLSALLCVFLVLVVDVYAGYAVRVTFFYVFFVLLVSWYLSHSWGMIISFISSFAWFFMNYRQLPEYVSFITHCWNTFSLLVILLMISYVASRLKIEKSEAVFAKKDILTGALNVRGLKKELLNIVQRIHANKGKLFSVIYIDLDNFKQVNDKFGHKEGDNVLKTIGKVIKYHIREVDTFARVGGDEFVLLIPDITDKIIKERISFIREKLLQAMKNRKWPVTFSIGLVNFHKLPHNTSEIIKIADETMYLAKKGGKNKIVSKTY